MSDGILFANWSTNDLDFTVSLSKMSCVRDFYFVHVIFCYLIFLTGLGCLITRLHSKLHPMHAWFGKGYWISMILATATSMLIHNTGLPPAVLLSFIWTLGGMSVAWILIAFHSSCMTSQAMKNVSEKLATGEISSKNLNLAVETGLEKGRIANKKTCLQRVFSLKAAHGALMFMSWLNIAGRIFASNQSGDFTCHTQPYYKPEYTASGLPEPVPAYDANYERLPWAKTGLLGWGVALSIGPLTFSYLFGAIWAAVAVRCSKTESTSVSNGRNSSYTQATRAAAAE